MDLKEFGSESGSAGPGCRSSSAKTRVTIRPNLDYTSNYADFHILDRTFMLQKENYMTITFLINFFISSKSQAKL